MKWLLLLAGGGFGAVLRFALALWVDERVGVHLPWGTLAVNAFSALGIETWQLVEDGHGLAAVGNAVSSVGAGIAAVVAGVVATRAVV